MNTRRLAILASHLERIEATPLELRERGFSMSFWLGKTHALPAGDLVRPSYSCGTAACAAGEATFIPEFRDEGLRMAHLAPYFEEESGYAALRKFFDISHWTANHIFTQSAYDERMAGFTLYGDVTPGMVAARIRDLIASEEPVAQQMALDFPQVGQSVEGGPA